MPTINSFRDLLVWQKAMDLAERCHRLSRRFSRQDQDVLGHEIRKSAISTASNIAEGHARGSTAVYVQHLCTARGSGGELETQLEIGQRVRIIPVEEAEGLMASTREIGRMLNGLIRSLERPTRQP